MKRLTRQILEQMLAESSEGIVVAEAREPDFPVVYANPEYERLSGQRADEIIGQRLPLLNEGRLDRDETEKLMTALVQGDRYETPRSDLPGDDTDLAGEIHVVPLHGRRSQATYFMMTHSRHSVEPRGISSVEVGVLQREITRARQKLTSMDRVDPVTGVLRHECFLELAERDFRMARRDSRAVAIVLFSIVDLDTYQQTFGKKAADSCMRMVAAQVNGALRRSGDPCARVDESSIVAMTHGQDLDDVRDLAMRIAANVRGLGLHNPHGRHGRHVTVRVGVAGGTPDENLTLAAAIAEAREDISARQPTQEPRYSASG